MAVNLYKKSKNENDEEEKTQILAQIQQDSLNRKNADIQAVKKVQNSLGYRYNAFVNNTAHNLVNLQRTATPIIQSTWNNIQNQANNFLNRTKTYFSNTKKSPEPMQAQNTSTWNKVQSVSQNAPTVQPSANMTVPTTKGMEEKRNEQVKQQQEKSKDFKETIRQNSHIATQEEIANTQVTSPEAYLKAQEYAKKAEKGDYSFLFEKAGDEIISGGQNALGGIVQGFAGLGQMATRALGADNATNALMNFSDEMLTKQNRSGETRQLLKQNLERAGKGGFLNDVLNVGGNLVESVSNTVISGAFGGGSGSTFGMGLSAGGNAFAKRQKESNGQNYARNVVASSLEGVWNSVWEKATGGNLLTRKTSINDAGEVIAENTGWLDKFALEKIAKYAKNPRTINAVNKVWQQLGEVVEEVGTDLFSAITNDIVAKENFKENFNWAQEKETAFYTVLSTLVLSKLGLGGMEAQDLANQYGLSLEQVQQVEKEVDSFVEEHNVKTDEKQIGKIIDNLMDKNGLDAKTLDVDATLQNIYDDNVQGKATPMPESDNYKTNLQSMLNNLDLPQDIKAQIQPMLDSNATLNETQYNELKSSIKSFVEQNTEQQFEDLKNENVSKYDALETQLEELDNIKFEDIRDADSRKFYAQQINADYDTTAMDSILAMYPENRNGKRTVKAYKEIARQYGQQMAQEGLSFDQVRANTVGAWQHYEPSKNITTYDNQEHKSQGFQRLNSQVWSEEVYNSYKETMKAQLNQQKQAMIDQYAQDFNAIEENRDATLMTIDNLGQQAQESQLSPEEIQRQKDLVEQFAKNRGVNVRYDAEAFNDSNEEAKIVDLGNGKREMVINPNADPDAILVKLATHEMFHDTIRTKPHDKLTKLVMDKLQQDNRYQEWRNSVSEAYQEQLQGLNEQQQNALLDEEMTAKYLGEYLGDEQFVQDLVNSTERSTVQRIMDWIDNRLQQLKNIVTGNKEAEYWRKVRENFEKAYNSKYVGKEGQFYNINETTDNQGRQLSEQQQEYFKDSKARNEDGSLTTVYHGTNSAGFTTFNRNWNFYTDNKQMAQSYTGGTEMVDTKRLESVSDAKSWLKGITDEAYIEGNKVYYDDGAEMLSYDTKEDLLRNLKRDIQNELGNTEAGGTYEGYVNITNPVEVDAQGDKWSMIPIDGIKIDGIDDIKQFLNDYGSSTWMEKGKRRASTNDIVSAVESAIEDGVIQSDGVIIKNVYDEGGYGSITPKEMGTDYITFNSNQFKAFDNKTPTENPDIRYQKDTSFDQAIKEDNKGRKLSKGQQEFFANEDKKMLNDKGELKTLYHGTPYGRFYEFNDKNMYFLTESEQFAEDYAYQKSFEQEIDGDATVMEVYAKAEKVFDPSDANDIEALRKVLPDKLQFWANEYDKEIALDRIQRKDVLPPKWTKEQIEKAEFGHIIGDDRFGYNNDLFIGLKNNNEVVYTSHANYRALENLSNREKQEIKKKLLEGESVTLDSYYTPFGYMSYEGIEEGIEERKKSGNEYGAKMLQEVKDAIDNHQTWKYEEITDKVSPYTDSLEETYLNDIDNWLYIETLFDKESGKDVFQYIQDLGYDAINIYEKGISNYVVFNKNQIKDVNNQNPTSVNDIRYNKKSGSYDQYLKENAPQEGATIGDLNRLQSQQKLPIKQANQPKAQQSETKEANLPISQETTSIPLNNQKQRRAYKSIIESEMMSDEAKAIAKKFIGQDTYTPDSNAKQLSRADDRIQRNGVEKELDTLETNAMEGKTIKADDIAVGDRLIQYYSKVGDSENLQRAIRATAMAGTQAGRSVQAFALLRHQTPEGMAIWIQNSVDKLNSKTKNGQFDFTQEMQEKILNSTEENLQENVDKVMKELGQQVPKDILSKLDAWRYFSMLANPKTHIRNIVGNFAMGLTQRVSNKVAGTIEQVTGRDRTKTSIFERRSKANIEFAKNDLKNVSSQLGIGTSKYSNPQNAIQQNQRTFKSDALEKSLGRMFNLNDNLLEAEDNFGLKNAYVRNLSDYMSANKLNPNTITNEQLQKARAIAIDKALEATFHQASNLASVLNQLENKNIGTRLLLGGLVPFKKTPINVAKAGAEYSPAGLAKSLVYDTVQLRKGNINTNQWIDNISKGLTGTGIAVLGYALAKAGILKAGGDDDKEDKYKQAMGEQPYAITINGKSYSLDWLAPSGIPLFVGAELAKIVDDKTEKDGETENEVLKAMGRVADATSSLLNPMSEMSMISGITSTIQSFSQDSGQALMNLVVSPLKSYVGQTVPTALGQIARTMDTYERDTSSTETGLLPKAIDQTKNQIMNKIPGLRQMLPTKKDIWGEEVETQDYFHNAVLPYTEKEIKSNPVDTELNSLFEKTGENIYPNTSLAKTVTYEGSKTRLTNQDYNEFKESYGKNSYRILNNLINSNEYKSLSDEQKVKAIQDVYTYANNLNKYNYAQKKGITFETPSDVEKVNAIKANGGSETDYFKYKGITDGLTKDSEKISAIQNSKLSNKSKRAVYNATVGKDDTFYQSTDIDVNEYLKYKTANIEGTKDENGKTISGTKKQAQLDYINDNISGYENRLLLMGKDYKLSRSQQQDLASYIDTLPNADELFELLSKNFTVKNGTVYYK